jgi:hypothetical protein
MPHPLIPPPMTNTSKILELVDLEAGTRFSPASGITGKIPALEIKELFRKKNECQTKINIR